MSDFLVRPLNTEDKNWVAKLITERWGTESVIVHGQTYYPHDLPGFLALQDKQKAGLLTYHLANNQCEIVTFDSLKSSIGIGSCLIEAVKDAARKAGCKRLWVITTNDNLNALRFYQKKGFALVAVHRNAVDKSRKHKPIPLTGDDDIPIRDEIELELIIEQ